jgi:flagellar protein FlaG
MIVQNITSSIPAGSTELRSSASKARPEPQPRPVSEPSPQQVKQAAESINRVVKQSSSNLEFSFDASSRKLVVRMVDTETGELIRQVPSEVVLAIAESIEQYQKGLLLNQRA